MFKNLSTTQLSVYAALIITSLFYTFILGMLLLTEAEMSWQVVLTILISIFIISFCVIFFYLEKYIYRKIKLIYKIIHQSKRNGKVNKNDYKELNIGNVEQEVHEWATHQNKEIENLKSLEFYRREYIGNVSHELKTPIFNVQGYIHTLLDGAVEDHALTIKYLQRAANNLDRLQTIVEDLESISKLESGELVLDMQKFDIRKLTEEIFDDLEYQANERQVKLLFKEGASQGFNVLADREYIRQVLVNLLSNSIKYGKIGGQTKVSFYRLDQYILIEVTDNGLGIEEIHLKHLFDRFYRVDKGRSREQGGSGLGLSIVKHIIEAHSQTINVRSTPGSGTTFGFTLQKA